MWMIPLSCLLARRKSGIPTTNNRIKFWVILIKCSFFRTSRHSHPTYFAERLKQLKEEESSSSY